MRGIFVWLMRDLREKTFLVMDILNCSLLLMMGVNKKLFGLVDVRNLGLVLL